MTDKLLTFAELSQQLPVRYSVVHLQELRRRGVISAATKIGRRWLFNLQTVMDDLSGYAESRRESIDILG